MDDSSADVALDMYKILVNFKFSILFMYSMRIFLSLIFLPLCIELK